MVGAGHADANQNTPSGTSVSISLLDITSEGRNSTALARPSYLLTFPRDPHFGYLRDSFRTASWKQVHASRDGLADGYLFDGDTKLLVDLLLPLTDIHIRLLFMQEFTRLSLVSFWSWLGRPERDFDHTSIHFLAPIFCFHAIRTGSITPPRWRSSLAATIISWDLRSAVESLGNAASKGARNNLPNPW
ncbi:hypothetical protein B0J17DRAFT_718567 [Rhizoctonia solani]|nr:hypothetical protein B0J17DRAFT_718567 [Rhizoctonia solani]